MRRWKEKFWAKGLKRPQSATEMGFIKDRHSGWRERGVGEKGEAWAPPYRELRGRSELGASEATGRDESDSWSCKRLGPGKGRRVTGPALPSGNRTQSPDRFTHLAVTQPPPGWGGLRSKSQELWTLHPRTAQAQGGSVEGLCERHGRGFPTLCTSRSSPHPVS